MEHIVRAVETIRARYTAVIGDNFVDYNIERHEGNIVPGEKQTSQVAIGLQEYVRRSLDELNSEMHPFTIPTDIRFFEEYYGGLDLQFRGHRLALYGCGAGENYDYPSIIQGFDGDSQYHDGWLEIGVLQVVNNAATHGMDTIYLNSDLAGKVQTGAIVTIGVYQGDLIWEPHQQPYIMVADSFAAWLQRIAANDWTPFL